MKTNYKNEAHLVELYADEMLMKKGLSRAQKAAIKIDVQRGRVIKNKNSPEYKTYLDYLRWLKENLQAFTKSVLVVNAIIDPTLDSGVSWGEFKLYVRTKNCVM